MRLGLISDIHGNAAALEAVLESARAAEVDRLLCCGDIVGYYYDAARCIELLAEWPVEGVRGNHEKMLVSAASDRAVAEAVRRRYGSGLAVAMATLTEQQIHALTTLPDRRTLSVDGKRIELAHGAPWDPDQYIYPDAADELLVRCASGDPDYVVLGHTHYQFARRVGATVVLNPGSVGQARGKQRGTAQWAWLDVASGEHRLESVSYDPSMLIAEAHRRDPDMPYLHAILTAERVP